MAELHPALVLIVGAVAVAAVPRRWAASAAVGAAGLALVAMLRLDEGTRSTHDFYGFELVLARVDGLSRPFALVFTAVTLLVTVYGWSTMHRLERAAVLATAGAGVGVVLAGDLLTLFLFWELKVTTAVLLILARRSASASAAARRYLGVHVAGGAVLLGGIVWHLVGTGSLAFETLDRSGATWLILAGFALCAAVVPLHAWLPDAYPTATVAGTVALSAFTTKSAVYALARGFPGTEVLVWLGVAMAVLGVVYAVIEDDIRRLLSYHIVSQVGFMVAAVGVGTSDAVNGATAHATAHVLYKGLLLMGVGAVLYATGRSRTSVLGGLASAQPWVLVAYLIGAASISGVPLFSGFPAKELAVAAVGDGGYGTAQWLLKFASVGTFLSVALKLPALTWFGERRGPADEVPRRVPVPMYVAMAAAAIANVAIGVRPGLLYELLPAPVSFEPYTLAKVSEAVLLVVFTTVGFVLLRRLLVPSAKVSVDADWVYRELPERVRLRLGVRALRPGRRRDGDAPAAWTSLRSLASRLVRPAGQTVAPVAPGWVLGSVVVVAMVLVLAVSVVA